MESAGTDEFSIRHGGGEPGASQGLHATHHGGTEKIENTRKAQQSLSSVSPCLLGEKLLSEATLMRQSLSTETFDDIKIPSSFPDLGADLAARPARPRARQALRGRILLQDQWGTRRLIYSTFQT